MAYRTVSFGSANGSLATIGYRLRASDGTLGDRVTAGVAEVVAGSGTYVANVDESSAPVGIVWDIESGSEVVAGEDFAASTELAAVKTVVDGIAAKTTNLPASPAAVGSPMTLADGAIASAKFAVGTVNASATGALERLMLLVARYFPLPGGSVVVPKSGNGDMLVKTTAGATISTQAVTDDGSTQTLGSAS